MLIRGRCTAQWHIIFCRNGIKAEDEAAVAAACPRVDVTIAYENGEQQVILNGRMSTA